MQPLEWGSIADWVSGIGSISAGAIALYLSGSEKRSRRDADRPVISCRHEDGGGEGWFQLMIGFDNPSSKQWQCVKAEVIRPQGGQIVRRDDAYNQDQFGSPQFDRELRDSQAMTALPLMVDIGPVGSRSASWDGGGRGNYTYRHFYARRPEKGPIVLRLHLASLEPKPDRFYVDIRRL